MASMIHLLPGHGDPAVVLGLALMAVICSLLIISWVMTR